MGRAGEEGCRASSAVTTGILCSGSASLTAVGLLTRLWQPVLLFTPLCAGAVQPRCLYQQWLERSQSPEVALLQGTGNSIHYPRLVYCKSRLMGMASFSS